MKHIKTKLIFEDNFNNKLSSLYNIIQGNSYSISAWHLKDLNHTKYSVSSEYVIFDDEYNDDVNYTITLALVPLDYDVDVEYIHLANDSDVNMLDKDAVMKIVNEYDKNFDKLMKVGEFNI